MVDLIKKALYTGLGLAVLTKEKAEELVKDFAEQSKLSEHEGKEMVDSLMKQSDQARNDLQARIDEAVKSVVSQLNLASKDEVASLKAKVEELSAKMARAAGRRETPRWTPPRGPLTPTLSPAGRGRPLVSSAPVHPCGNGDHQHLLPVGEKVPEGRMRGGVARRPVFNLLGPVVFSEESRRGSRNSLGGRSPPSATGDALRLVPHRRATEWLRRRPVCAQSVSCDVDLILTLTGGLAAALVCGYVTFRLGLSPIVGYLLAGFVVGRIRRASSPTGGRRPARRDRGHPADVRRRLAVPPGGAAGRAPGRGAGGPGQPDRDAAGDRGRRGRGLGMARRGSSSAWRSRCRARSCSCACWPTPATCTRRAGHIAVGWLVVEDLFTVLVLVVLPAVFGGGGWAGGLAASARRVGWGS